MGEYQGAEFWGEFGVEEGEEGDEGGEGRGCRGGGGREVGGCVLVGFELAGEDLGEGGGGATHGMGVWDGCGCFLG